MMLRAGQEENIDKVLEWKIDSNDNVLHALLTHNMDKRASEYMGIYSHFLDEDLFLYCIDHGNNIFLQDALLLSAFDKMIFREEQVIGEILNILREGHRTNFIMNVLTLVDISVWKNKHLNELVQVINGYVDQQCYLNTLMLSQNPLQTIALAAELLSKVASSRRKFENECIKIRDKLLRLGKIFSSKIFDHKYYEKLIMDIDLKGRTVLKVITTNQFEPLMDGLDPKAENMMLNIWHGKEASQCDGNVYCYSSFVHILDVRVKKAKKADFWHTVTNSFEPKFYVDYPYQYVYRSKAISFYFVKEFICALAMLALFQFINYQYLIKFSKYTIQEATVDDFLKKLSTTDAAIF
jgi:hypothetical protein